MGKLCCAFGCTEHAKKAISVSFHLMKRCTKMMDLQDQKDNLQKVTSKSTIKERHKWRPLRDTIQIHDTNAQGPWLAMKMIKEEAHLILPPNKEHEAVYEFSRTPTIYEHLIFLDFNNLGNCILGSSNITGTFWEGTLIFCKNFEDLKHFKHSTGYIYLTAADGKFINNDTIALAEESGVLNIMSAKDERILKPINHFRHQGRIPQIAVWNHSSNVLSCSGKGLAIWDINNLERTPMFISDKVHLADINSVDTFIEDTNLFVSASADKKACLWDARAELPTVLYANEFCSLTRIAVNQVDSNYIVIGTLAGDIYLIDKREPKIFLAVHHCFDYPISSLLFNHSHHVAVAGHTNQILSMHTNNGNLKEAYRDTRHLGIVKDLKWQKNTIYSCGFNKEILEHLGS